MKTLLLSLIMCVAASAQYVPTYSIVAELPTPTGSGKTYVLASDSTRYVDGPRGWRKIGGAPSTGWVTIGAGGGDMYRADSTTYYMTRNEVKDSLGDVRASIPSTASFVAKADSATMPGYVTRTQFSADTTYKAAQLLTRIAKADSATMPGYVTRTQFAADTTYKTAQDVAIRAVQAADSTYKAAQIALRKLNSDTTAATGYLRNWQLWDKGGSYLEVTKGTRKFFAKNDSAGGAGEVNTASNLTGSGVGLWKDKSTYDLRFKRIKATAPLTVTDNTDSVTIATGGMLTAWDTTRNAYLDKAQTIAGAQTVTGTMNGAVPYTYLFKSGDTTLASIWPYRDIGELQFNMLTSGVYEIKLYLIMSRATAANGYTIAANFSQNPTATYLQGRGPNTGVVQLTDQISTNLDSVVFNGTTVTTHDETTVTGIIVNAGSGTALKFRFHCEVATNVIIRKGSYLAYRKLY
jgi:hypothetical protein